MGKKQNTLDIQAIYQNAITLHQQGEISQAIKLYQQLLEQVPEIAEIHYNLGLAWFELEQYTNAIQAFQNATELDPHDSDIFFNLGLACKMDKQFEAAEEAYLHALELSDDVQDILYNLGCCYQDSGSIENACVVFEKLLQLVPDHLSALNNLAYLKHLQEHFESARELYGRVLELDPDRQSAKHMYATLSGKGEPAPPQEYVRELFDQYSDNFEENLIKDLEYNTFCILRQAVEGLTEQKKRYAQALDLGCGTGLAGDAFHSICTRLTGVDLSENMIKQSSEKRLYHELHCADIIDFLEQTNQNYDLIIAADVFPYLGNLTPLFSAASKRATDNTVFCLSSEKTTKPEWELQLTGRYAHNTDYVASTAKKYGWTPLECFPANIRKENNAWIKGTIFVFGRNQIPLSVDL